MKLHVFRTVPLSIIRSFFTVHTAMVYVIQVCGQLASRIRMFHPDPARKLSANLYDICHRCVYSEKLLMMDSCQQTCMTNTITVRTVKKTSDDGQSICPKHVKFHSKNKFEKLVHLVGFNI